MITFPEIPIKLLLFPIGFSFNLVNSKCLKNHFSYFLLFFPLFYYTTLVPADQLFSIGSLQPSRLHINVIKKQR